MVGYIDSEWAKVRYEIVLRGVIKKYRQNAHLRELLLATQDLQFVEASPYDRIWGIGMRSDDPPRVRCLATGSELARTCHDRGPQCHQGLTVDLTKIAVGDLLVAHRGWSLWSVSESFSMWSTVVYVLETDKLVVVVSTSAADIDDTMVLTQSGVAGWISNDGLSSC